MQWQSFQEVPIFGGQPTNTEQQIDVDGNTIQLAWGYENRRP